MEKYQGTKLGCRRDYLNPEDRIWRFITEAGYDEGNVYEFQDDGKPIVLACLQLEASADERHLSIEVAREYTRHFDGIELQGDEYRRLEVQWDWYEGHGLCISKSEVRDINQQAAALNDVEEMLMGIVQEWEDAQDEKYLRGE